MQYLAIAAAVYCIVSLFAHFVKIVRLGTPKDKSEPSGSVKEGVIYANTRAMMPTEKESAYLHLPSYAVGMLFHIGLFCSLLFFVLFFFPCFNSWIEGSCWRWVLAIPPAIATVCGLILFFRRLLSKDLKVLSMPDDFISTGLVTLFLLSLLGVDRAEIMRVYLGVNRRQKRVAFATASLVFLLSFDPKLVRKDYDYFIARPAYLTSAIDTIESRFGSMEDFLRDTLHVTDAQRDAFRARVLG